MQSNFQKLRQRMVEEQLRLRGIQDPQVLQAMAKLPREAFIGEGQKPLAYEDSPLPIGFSQTISQPYMVAAMLEAAALKAGQRILDIGTGCGYAAAIASLIVDEVYTVERIPGLAEMAKRNFEKLKLMNIHIRLGDGFDGWPERSPFDAILVAAVSKHWPEKLKAQIKEGGRMIIPIEERGGAQYLHRLTRKDAHFSDEVLMPVRFVPMLSGVEKPV